MTPQMRPHHPAGAEREQEKAPGMPNWSNMAFFACIDCFDRHPAQFLRFHHTAHDHLDLKFEAMEFTGGHGAHQRSRNKTVAGLIVRNELPHRPGIHPGAK